MKEMFKMLSGLEPELQAGTDAREKAAARCAKADAPILGQPEDQLREFYEELFFNTATEELFEKIAGHETTAQQRWDLSLPARIMAGQFP